ncbi:MAG: hypothetical protein PHN56_00705 [Candidatus Nanoarchaeia archaeon]|nr:hypothetical protein [Candidatus Nanoarchaeia archaeon]
MTNKTITPVISVILLIMLTIAVSATAWYWVNGLQANLESSTAQGVESTTSMGNIQYNIVSLTCNSSATGNITIQLRNNGLTDISTDEVFLIKLVDASGVELNSTTKQLSASIGTSGLSTIGSLTFLTRDLATAAQMVNGTRYQIKTDVRGITASDYCTAI